MSEDVMLKPFREAAAKELEGAISDITNELADYSNKDIRQGLMLASSILWGRVDKLMPEWADADE
jgi:hypothetical protein